MMNLAPDQQEEFNKIKARNIVPYVQMAVATPDASDAETPLTPARVRKLMGIFKDDYEQHEDADLQALNDILREPQKLYEMSDLTDNIANRQRTKAITYGTALDELEAYYEAHKDQANNIPEGFNANWIAEQRSKIPALVGAPPLNNDRQAQAAPQPVDADAEMAVIPAYNRFRDFDDEDEDSDCEWLSEPSYSYSTTQNELQTLQAFVALMAMASLLRMAAYSPKVSPTLTLIMALEVSHSYVPMIVVFQFQPAMNFGNLAGYGIELMEDSSESDDEASVALNNQKQPAATPSWKQAAQWKEFPATRATADVNATSSPRIGSGPAPMLTLTRR